MIHFDGSHFRDTDALVLAALTLSAATGEPFEIENVGRGSGTLGVTPFHVTALEALGKIVRAEVKGASVRARRIRFSPTSNARAGDYVVDSADSTGRPSPVSVAPLLESIATVLSGAGEDSLVTVRGVNAHPQQRSVFWMRETLTPALHQIGYNVGVEIERWGWYPDGGGECTLSVSARDEIEGHAPVRREVRGKIESIWITAILSSRMDEAVGEKMVEQLLREVAFDKIERGHIESEIIRVRSAGAGSGIFVTLETEMAAAGFEAIGDGQTSPVHIAERCAAAANLYLNSTAALDNQLSRALLIPLALSGRAASLTSPALTGAHTTLEQVIPEFLPTFCATQNREAHRIFELVPTR